MQKTFFTRCGLVLLSSVITWQFCQTAQSKDEKEVKTPRTLITNFDQTEKEKFPWGNLCWLRGKKIEADAPMTFGLVEIEPGKTNPLHLHPNCDEYLYVLSGECKHIVGEEIVVLKKGDLARIRKGTKHKAMVTSKEPLKAVIVYDSGDRQAKVLEENGKE